MRFRILTYFLINLTGVALSENSVNIALNKPTSTSGTLFGNPSSRVVDGRVSQDYNTAPGCFIGGFNSHSWLRVDLQGYYYVKRVKIYLSDTECWGYRRNVITDVTKCYVFASGYEIYVSVNSTDSISSNDLCYRHLGTATAIEDVTCDDVSASRYVTIVLPFENSELVVCELQVFGDEDKCRTNNGGCQHTCTSTPSEFRCSCYQGYRLRGDKRSCRPVCDDFRRQHNSKYFSHEIDCSRYYQCVGRRLIPYVRLCDRGSFWQDTSKTCAQSYSVSCPTDPCLNTSIQHHPNPDCCASYWVCSRGRSHSLVCCHPGQEYGADGCVESTTCHNDCVQAVHDEPATLNCPQEIYLPFDHGVQNIQQIWVHKQGAFRIVRGIAGTVGRGTARFRHSSQISIPRFSGDDFRNKLTIRFRYNELVSETSGNETLVSNCAADWSVYVGYDRSTDSTIAGIATVNTRATVVVINPPGWKAVEYKYDGTTFSLTVGSVVTQTPVSGLVRIQSAPLRLGGPCRASSGFHGYIDEFYLYKCTS